MLRHLSVILPLVVLATWSLGCLSDLESLCQADADCPSGHHCAPGEIRACVPGPGGDGGRGGKGGSGGVGGDGGSGGDGGTGGFDPVELDVELRFELAKSLGKLLEKSSRPVHQVVVTYDHTSGLQEEKLPQEPAVVLPGEGTSLPLFATKSQITVRAEAWSRDADGTEARFAHGETVLPMPSDPAATVPLSITLSLDSNFDFDRDGDPDVGDCAREDPNVFRGAPEVCNGIQNDCDESPFCFILLPQNQEARDLSCSPSTGKCVAAIGDTAGGGTEGSIRIYDASFDTEAIIVDVADPLGVAVNDADEAGETVAYTTTREVNFLGLDGAHREGMVATSGDLSGPISISPVGSKGVVPHKSRPVVDVFNPSDAAKSGAPVTCKEVSLTCKKIQFSDIKNGPLDSTANPNHVAMIHLDSFSDPLLFVTFSNDPRLAVLQFNILGDISPTPSGLLSPVEAPRSMSLFHQDTRIAVAGQHESSIPEATSLIGGNISEINGEFHPFALPAGSCPAALDGKSSPDSLLMADDCTESIWRIPLDEEGRPIPTSDTDSQQIKLADCAAPHVLASLPAVGETTATTFIGCKGENRILVLDRH